VLDELKATAEKSATVYFIVSKLLCIHLTRNIASIKLSRMTVDTPAGILSGNLS